MLHPRLVPYRGHGPGVAWDVAVSRGQLPNDDHSGHVVTFADRMRAGEWLADRGFLDVRLSLARIHGDVPDRFHVLLASITASNPRRIPVTINSFGWDTGKGGSLLWDFSTSQATLPFSV